MDRSVEVEFARVAAVIGEPARAAMLGGEPLTAGELARRAGVIPATASGHRARLADSRPTTRPCLDWSERREHLAGAAGAALASALLERRWIARIEGSRAVRVTVRGRDGLQRVLSLEVPPDPS